MVEKDQITKEKIKHKGLFDFAKLYSFAHSWWREREFGVTEEKYEEKVSGNSRNINIEWKIGKNISDYFRFEYKVKFSIAGMTEVETEIDGEKKKLNNGEVEVEVAGILVRDRSSKYDSSPFNRFIRDVYSKYVIPSRIEGTEEKNRENAVSFKEEIKAFLGLTGRR